MKPAASIMTIEEPQDSRPASLPFLPILRLGFRPFYLLAALFAFISIPLWLLSYSGVALPTAELNLLWHAHEMVLGFASAVVVGFLFTAARNWTGLWTPRGWELGIIAGIWVLGRIGMLLPLPLARAATDLLFIPIATVPLFKVLWRSGNHRNLPLLGLLALLFLANLAFHAATLGWSPYSAVSAVEAAVLVLAVLSTVMGGRVIPMFTTNMAKGSQPKSIKPLDTATLALTLAASLAWIAGLTAWLTATLALSAGLVQLVRLVLWSPHRTARYPLLWILHLAVAWLAFGYLALAAATAGYASVSTAIHIIAVGGMSSLIMGMITRTTIGHTGRTMRADHHELTIFIAIQCAAVARILANVVPTDLRNVLLVIAAVGWVTAFGIYCAVFGPFLCSARLDGRDG